MDDIDLNLLLSDYREANAHLKIDLAALLSIFSTPIRPRFAAKSPGGEPCVDIGHNKRINQP